MIEALGQKPHWQSAKLKDIPALLEGELHVWWLPLTLQEPQKSEALKLLNDIQRDKHARRATDELQEAYLAGRYFLLHLLAAYTEVDPHEIDLSYTRLNKPYLSNNAVNSNSPNNTPQNLHFNFTDTRGHNTNYGVFTFAHEHEVGVDIEAKHRHSNFDRIAQKRFTPQENKFVYDDGVLNPEKFLAIWTRKEAFGKATGRGINFTMNERNLASDGKHELTFFDDDDQAWRLLQMELGEEFIASVVHASHQELSVKAFHSLEI